MMNVLSCSSDYQRRRMTPAAGSGAVTIIPDLALTNYAACHHDVESPDRRRQPRRLLPQQSRHDSMRWKTAWATHDLRRGEAARRCDELGWGSGTRSTLRNTGNLPNRTASQPVDLAAYPTFSNDPSSHAIDPRSGDSRRPARRSRHRSRPPANLVGGFGSFSSPRSSNFLMGDGSVRLLQATGSTLQDLSTPRGHRADGELDRERIGSDRRHRPALEISTKSGRSGRQLPLFEPATCREYFRTPWRDRSRSQMQSEVSYGPRRFRRPSSPQRFGRSVR